MIFDGFDTGLIVSKDAEQDLALMYKIRISRKKSRLPGKNPDLGMKKILACIIILDISIFGQFKPDFNEHQNRGRTVDEREEDIFKA